MKRWAMLCVWGGLLAVSVPGPVRGEFPDGYNHAEVAWQEFATDHFTVVFNRGLESTARLAGGLLEQVHARLCAHLGVTPPRKTTVVLADFDDVGASNFAKRLEHVIYLSNPVMNQARVDREQWLSHLLAHEYTHVLNGWALRLPANEAGVFTEWAGMELQPQWFTEGLAEYEANACAKSPVTYVLHAARQRELLHGAKLDIADARFNVIETGTVYKQGHAMCIELARRCGEDVFARLVREFVRTPQWDLAFLRVTGISPDAFVRNFLRGVREAAEKLPATEALDAHSQPVRTGLTAALGGRLSPDGKQLAFYGIADWEEPIPALYLARADGSGARKVAQNLDLYASWKLTWSPDSQRLVFVGRVRDGRGAVRNGLFVYDVATERVREWRIPGAERVGEPEFSPDGKRLVFGTYRGERALVAVVDVDGGLPRLVTGKLGADAFSPTWSPDGTRLAMSVTDSQGTDLAVINIDGSGYRRLTTDVWPDQYPAWSPDSRRLAFVSFRAAGETGDRSAAVAGEAEGLSGAATNLYTISVDGGPMTQVTRATSGGVFYPAWTADSSKLLISLFKVRRAELRLVPATPPAAIAATTALATAATPDGPTASASAAAPQAALVGPSLPATGRESAAASAASWSPPADAAPPAVNAQAPTGARPAAPIPAAQPGGPAPARPYRPLAHTKLYLARPTNDNDGLGTTWGVRAKLADPLAKHQFTLEGSYGYKSERGQYAVEYLNDQTPLHLGVRFAKQVPALRGERDALVAETTEGAELLAELPLTLSRNAYAKDRLSFGFEALDHRPFATAGGALYPPPQPTLVTAPSVALRRTQLLPGRGDQEVSAKLTRADRFWGGDLAFTSAKLSYTTRRWAPSPRQVARVGGALQWFDGQDYSRTQVTQTLGTGELGYQCRVADQVLSRYTWPYVHVGPVYFDASYQTRAGISGQTRGLDLRDRFRAEMLNSGYLSRNFAYDLKAGQTTYIERGRAPVDWYLQVTFKMRDLPF